MIIANINVRSLKAHSGDIKTNSVLQKWDYFACSETWMRYESAVQISGFECVAKRNNRSQGERTADDVAIYRNLQSVSMCRQLVPLYRRIRLTDNLVGDFCMVNMTTDQESKFILGAVYIHPNAQQESIKYFMFQMLGTYSEAITLIFPSMNPDTETPILLCGDFNTDITQNKSFVNFMKPRLNLECRSSAPTTLGNTWIHLTFTRNVSVQTLPYVSYFSNHRPVLNKLMLNNNEQ
jgi:hypothetical protein